MHCQSTCHYTHSPISASAQQRTLTARALIEQCTPSTHAAPVLLLLPGREAVSYYWGHSGPVYGLDYSPDNQLLFSSSGDGTIRWGWFARAAYRAHSQFRQLPASLVTLSGGVARQTPRTALSGGVAWPCCPQHLQAGLLGRAAHCAIRRGCLTVLPTTLSGGVGWPCCPQHHQVGLLGQGPHSSFR